MSYTLEAVLIRVKADQLEQFPTLVSLADAFLAKQPGFVRRAIHQTHDKPEVFLDLVYWESLETAQAAGELLMKDPALQPFVTAIEEVLSFNHCHLYGPAHEATAEVATAVGRH